MKLLKRLNREANEDRRKEKKWIKDINKLPVFLKEHQEKEVRIKAGMEKRAKDEKEEKERQEGSGVVEKPKLIGRYKYRMRKTEFQTEEELAGSLRTVRIKATPADLLVDRYDSIFRRNLIAPEAPIGGDRKRGGKAKFKWHNSRGGSGAEKLDKKNKKLKQSIEKKLATGPSMLKNDLILI